MSSARWSTASAISLASWSRPVEKAALYVSLGLRSYLRADQRRVLVEADLSGARTIRVGGGLELTEFVYTSGPLRGRRSRDREELVRGATRRLAFIRHAQEVTGNVSLTCRYFGITRRPSVCGCGVTRSRAWKAPRPLTKASRDPARHQARGGRQDRLPQAELSLRTSQDSRWISSAITTSRSHPGGLADPEASGHEPAAGIPAVPTARGSVEALREAPAGPPGPDRREVHRTAAGVSQEALPVHRDDCTRIRVLWICDRLNSRAPSGSWTTCSRSCRSRSR
jgi:hypothetical protein